MTEAPPNGSPALIVEGLHVYYGKSHVVRGASISMAASCITTLLGRNGVGKSTLVNAIMGVLPSRQGKVELLGENVSRSPSWYRARKGLVLVPQGHRVFPNLTVRENISIAGVRSGGPWPLTDLFDLFPSLAGRADTLAGALSGGEQKMLSIAQALRSEPKVLLMDEPSEGLAPQILELVRDLLLSLARIGLSVLLVEQKAAFALAVADNACVMERGAIVFQGTAHELGQRSDVQHRYLGV